MYPHSWAVFILYLCEKIEVLNGNYRNIECAARCLSNDHCWQYPGANRPFPKVCSTEHCPAKSSGKASGSKNEKFGKVSPTCYFFWRITMLISILCSEERQQVHAVQPSIVHNLEPQNPFVVVELGVTISISLIYYLPQNAQIPLRGLMHRIH